MSHRPSHSERVGRLRGTITREYCVRPLSAIARESIAIIVRRLYDTIRTCSLSRFCWRLPGCRYAAGAQKRRGARRGVGVLREARYHGRTMLTRIGTTLACLHGGVAAATVACSDHTTVSQTTLPCKHATLRRATLAWSHASVVRTALVWSHTTVAAGTLVCSEHGSVRRTMLACARASTPRTTLACDHGKVVRTMLPCEHISMMADHTSVRAC